MTKSLHWWPSCFSLCLSLSLSLSLSLIHTYTLRCADRGTRHAQGTQHQPALLIAQEKVLRGLVCVYIYVCVCVCFSLLFLHFT
jgi:hypothetical protein